MSNQHLEYKYYPLFDWLRLILSLVVYFFHTGVFTWPQSGNFAVQVFFALSGWLIGGILLNTEKTDLPRFYFNRALRIWVPYFFTLILLVLASVLHDSITSKWLEIIFYKLTFVYNLFGVPQIDVYRDLFPLQGTGNHFWSVNAEEQFYLLSPLLLVLVPTRVGKSILIWGVIAILAIVSQTYASIVLGVLCAVIVRNRGAFHVKKYFRVSFCLIMLVSATCMYESQFYMQFAPFCAVSIVMLLAVPGRKSVLGQFAGGVSYPLYMNAWVVGVIIHSVVKHLHIHSPILVRIIDLIASLLIASMIYWFVEKRVLAMRYELYTLGRAILITIVAYASVFVGIIGGIAMQRA